MNLTLDLICKECLKGEKHGNHKIMTHPEFLNKVYTFQLKDQEKPLFDSNIVFDIKKNKEIIKRYINEIKSIQKQFIENIQKNFEILDEKLSKIEDKINGPEEMNNPKDLVLLLRKANTLSSYMQIVQKIQNFFVFHKEGTISLTNPNYNKKIDIQSIENFTCNFKTSLKRDLENVQKELNNIFNFDLEIKKESNPAIQTIKIEPEETKQEKLAENQIIKPLKKIYIKKQSFSYEGLPLDKLYQGLKEITCHFCQRSSFEKELYTKLGKIYGPYEIKEKKYYFHEMCVLWSNGIEMDQNNSIEHTLEKEIERTKHIKCKKCNGYNAGIHCLNKNCDCTYHFRCLLGNNSLKMNYSKLSFVCLEHLNIHKSNDSAVVEINNKRNSCENLCSNSKKIKKRKGSEK